MKIAVIASNAQMLLTLKEALESNPGQDQFVFLQRHSSKLSFDEVDLFSTHIVIADTQGFNKQDLEVIASSTRNSTNPAFIYVCPTHTEEELLDMMHAGITEVLSLPVNSQSLRESIERIRSRHYIETANPPRGKILSFVSCKGGAGATFLATNLGYVIATEFKKKVLYIDLHTQYGDAVFYLSESAGQTSFADIIGQAGLDSTVVASGSMQIAPNYYLLQAPDSIERTSGIKPQQIDNLLTVAVQDFDFVIVDMAETFDGLTMKALDRSEFVFVVMQPVLTYVRAMSKILHVFTLLGYSAQKVRVVLNRMVKDSSPSQDKIEEGIQKVCDWVVPNDFVNSMESANAGVPILKLAPNSDLTKSLLKMASSLTGDASSSTNGKSFLSRLFG